MSSILLTLSRLCQLFLSGLLAVGIAVQFDAFIPMRHAVKSIAEKGLAA
jgi:hypothetical protein